MQLMAYFPKLHINIIIPPHFPSDHFQRGYLYV
jgi:hypothetical protein